MARVLRQVDVILQNHTSELLTLESAVNVQGDWDPAATPRPGALITKQGAGKWTSISTVDGTAAQGFIRFGSTKGYIEIRWMLPRNAAVFDHAVVTPEGLSHTISLSGASDDYRVMMVTLRPDAPLVAPGFRRRPQPPSS